MESPSAGLAASLGLPEAASFSESDGLPESPSLPNSDGLLASVFPELASFPASLLSPFNSSFPTSFPDLRLIASGVFSSFLSTSVWPSRPFFFRSATFLACPSCPSPSWPASFPDFLSGFESLPPSAVRSLDLPPFLGPLFFPADFF